MEHSIDFEGLANFLLFRIRDLLPVWLPGGHMVGHEYCCANLLGGNGKSCKVNIQSGRWADFASGDKGGDLISLFAAIQRINQVDAARQLIEQHNYTSSNAAPSTAVAEYKPVMPPADAIIPDMKHPQHGDPAHTWVYRNADGDRMFYIARYNTAKGKEFIPWTWSGTRWTAKGWPAPRPLYGLAELTKYPNKPVLIVEGEKAADAAGYLAPAYVVVTWPGGAKAYSKADWTPIKGRSVLIWPDNDAPGVDAANAIAQMIAPTCKEVKILKLQGLDAKQFPAGFDAADAAGDGWEKDDFIKWARGIVQVFNLTINQTQINNYHQDEPPAVPNESNAALWDRLGLAMTQQGYPIANEDNVARIFEGTPALRRALWKDVFHQSIFIDDPDTGPRPWVDEDTYKLTMHLQRFYGLSRISDSVVRRAIVVLAGRVIKNEPMDWFKSLAWDNTPRIDNFFVSHLGAKSTPYVNAASKNFWISMVARVYNPGCIMRSMVILKSKQMAGKSTAFSLIGGKWYSEALESIQSNNFLQSLHGNLIVEFGDLAGMDRAEVNRIKQIISCRKDRFRAPYDRSPTDHLRQCVLVGSTNEGHFLRDDTGGTRFWPIETGYIDHAGIARDREQLFAEAVARFKGGDNWHIMPTDETEMVQESYRQGDEWEAIISDYLMAAPSFIEREITVVKIAADCLKIPVDRLDKSTQIRIARNLSTIGWEKKTKRFGETTKKVWVQKNVSNVEVETFD